MLRSLAQSLSRNSWRYSSCIRKNCHCSFLTGSIKNLLNLGKKFTKKKQYIRSQSLISNLSQRRNQSPLLSRIKSPQKLPREAALFQLVRVTKRGEISTRLALRNSKTKLMKSRRILHRIETYSLELNQIYKTFIRAKNHTNKLMKLLERVVRTDSIEETK